MSFMEPLAAIEQAAAAGLMPEESSILLAVSGGADSMALLYGAAAAAPVAGWRLTIGHVHHGWRGRSADRDLAFVSGHARRLGLAFLSRRCDARAEARRSKLSPEAAARRVRYAALAEMAREAQTSLIATAHQRDDRVESFLLALQRRAGLATLAGPRRQREDGVVRPLLSVSREAILEFLRRRGIGFRRDATNGDLAFPRNRIRRVLANLSAALGEEAIEALAHEVERLDAEREKIDREFAARVRPRLSVAPGSVIADAAFLEECPVPLLRHAIEEAARPFAAPGRPPMTGREREQILRRLAEGGNFRFEAGRRIIFERRGALLKIGPRPFARHQRV
jgi:tRNA(Ile)-lysidine synthase